MWSNSFLDSSSLITGTTWHPSCPAGQFFKASEPLMKSFCTSTKIRAVMGLTSCQSKNDGFKIETWVNNVIHWSVHFYENMFYATSLSKCLYYSPQRHKKHCWISSIKYLQPGTDVFLQLSVVSHSQCYVSVMSVLLWTYLYKHRTTVTLANWKYCVDFLTTDPCTTPPA